MHTVRRLLQLAVSIAVVGCSESETTPIEPTVPVFDQVLRDASATPLRGAEEVPARTTRARGTATFEVSDDRLSLDYRLIVANIENVIQAHIHVGPAGANGPVVAFLFGLVAPGGGRVDGVLAEGTITAANLVGPLTGMTIEDLLDEILSGNAYVNVHTNDGVAPSNTGPGDFPGGEVRGQM